MKQKCAYMYIGAGGVCISGKLFRRDAIAQRVLATATWLGGWLAGWLSVTAGIVSKRLNLF